MEYIYAALLIHKAGHKVEEGVVKKVLEAAGVKVDDARCKVLVASLEGLNIDEAIAKAAIIAAPVAAVASTAAPAEKKAEKKDEKKSEEAAAAGLGALFG
ncbi:MAG: 50S ribosomal protein P1 [Nanoarchaeota archaeon]